jgi:hypothetical protein
MTELIIYALVFALILAHTIMASFFYGRVHRNEKLTVQQKNEWKLKALIFPAYFYGKYKVFEASLK